MKKNILKWLCLIPLFTACIDDNGNYDYTEMADITVENLPEQIEVLGYVEHIQFSPKIVSSLEGEIKADNPNFSVQYRLGYKGMGSLGGYDEENQTNQNFVDITPENGFDLNIPARYSPNTYVCWMTITDKRNNVVSSHTFDVRISSTTSQGWLVLCNEGNENRVRLDMISQITSTRTETLRDVAKGMPESHEATCISYDKAGSGDDPSIAIFTHGDDYMLDVETLESGPEWEFNMNNFSVQPAETLFKEYKANKYRFGISESGNAYVRESYIVGPAYSLPINTLKPGIAPSFRVDQHVGYSKNPGDFLNALFYDIDNKRFLCFLGTTLYTGQTTSLCLSTIEEPENPKFSYSTGKELVYMEGTSFNNGLVCAILQDETGNRSLYGINVYPEELEQLYYIENIEAPEIRQAEHFAFYSKGPLMLYATANKVYMYNYVTKASQQIAEISLGANEEITQMKFNTVSKGYGEENKEHHLTISSYDTSAEGTNNGKVAFYNITQKGLEYEVSKTEEYDGFAKVVDVIYKDSSSDY